MAATLPAPQGGNAFASSLRDALSSGVVDDLHWLRLACQVADYEVALGPVDALANDAARRERQPVSAEP